MAENSSDSVPIPGFEPALRREPNSTGLATGLFHADADIAIANRLVEKMRANGCDVELFNFHDAGDYKFCLVESFVQSKQLVLWLATNAALNDRGILEAARHIAQYASIVRRDLNIRFSVLQPSENLNAKLPLSLGAYSSLQEDGMFQTRLQTTMTSVAKALAQRGIHIRPQMSTASSAAVSNDAANQYRRVAPNSDVIAEHQLQFGGEGEPDLTASPEKERIVEADDADADETANGTIGSPPSGQARVSVNTYHIHIHGEQNAVQIGSDSSMNMNLTASAQAESAKRKRDDADDKDGTPV